MRNDDFECFLGLVDRLKVEQKQRLLEAIAASDDEAMVIEVIENRLGPKPACPHCEVAGARPWGRSHGLKRYRCGGCGRTFNALTGTPLARLRKKLRWLEFARCLSTRATVREAAGRCRVAKSTSFRWRHRFLNADVANAQEFSGIVEADETFFRESFKGSWCWRNGHNPPARPPKRRATPAKKRGLSDEQIPVLISRDRSGATRAAILPNRSAQSIDAAIGQALPKDAVLCTDTWRPFAVTARKRGIQHEAVNLNAGIPVREKTWHIQNVNARHSRLKSWIAPFRGVATKNLPNYLAWHHVVDAKPGIDDHLEWLRLAINS